MRNRKLRIDRIVFLTAVGWLAGCAGSGAIVESPSVALSGVAMRDLSFTGQTFLLSFDVSNPNPFPLPIKSVRYHVQLDDQNFASGETPGDFSIPASGSGGFDISVELDILKSASHVGTLLRSGMRRPVPYRLDGSLTVGLPFVKPLPFSASGVIALAAN